MSAPPPGAAPGAAPLRVGVAGLGSVGAAAAAALLERGAAISTRAGRPVVLARVAARDRRRDRGVDLSSVAWDDDAAALAAHSEVDLVIEAIGGDEGAAPAVVEAALSAGRPVVTANKALLSRRGAELARLAESRGAPLLFEAAVGSAMPCVSLLREDLAADEVVSLRGVLNGACNFVLSEMERAGATMQGAVEAARAAGFLEADPSLDLDGWDAAHKLSLLAALAFDEEPALAAVDRVGISALTGDDIAAAAALGRRVRLLATAERGAGAAGAAPPSRRVEPTLVPEDSLEARLSGPENLLAVESRAAGASLLRGVGAGGAAAACALLADVVRVARGAAARPVFRAPAEALRRAPEAPAPAPPGDLALRFSDPGRSGASGGLDALPGRLEGAGLAPRRVERRAGLLAVEVASADPARARAAADSLAAEGFCAPAPSVLRLSP